MWSPARRQYLIIMTHTRRQVLHYYHCCNTNSIRDGSIDRFFRHIVTIQNIAPHESFIVESSVYSTFILRSFYPVHYPAQICNRLILSPRKFSNKLFKVQFQVVFGFWNRSPQQGTHWRSPEKLCFLFTHDYIMKPNVCFITLFSTACRHTWLINHGYCNVMYAILCQYRNIDVVVWKNCSCYDRSSEISAGEVKT